MANMLATQGMQDTLGFNTSEPGLGKIGKCFTFALNHLMPTPPSKVLSSPSFFVTKSQFQAQPGAHLLRSLIVAQNFRLSLAFN